VGKRRAGVHHLTSHQHHPNAPNDQQPQE